MPKSPKKLPNEIIPIKNKDKKNHEKWYPGRNLLDFPSPTRMCVAGPPHSGKTLTIQNIILRADPPYDEIYLLHADKKSKDYEDCNPIMLDELPAPDEWPWDDKKKLLIIDDVNYNRLSKEQMVRLESCYKFVSTHKNMTVCCTSQNYHNINVTVRRASNLFICWRIPDETSFKTIANKVGIKQNHFIEIFNNFCPHYQDSLWIDITINTPAKVRRNGYEVIKIEKIN